MARKTKYEILGNLLEKFGKNQISRDTFFREMDKNKLTQDDIDNWLAQYYATGKLGHV